MTPDLFKQLKNLFLIFPPGCGGNHVANMLSMTPYFEPRYTHDNYYENMIWNYDNFFASGPQDKIGCTAHFACDLENLQQKELAEFESKVVNSKKSYIFCSHAVEYLYADFDNVTLKPYDRRFFCVFSIPTGKNKTLYNRLMTGLWAQGETATGGFAEVSANQLYNPETFAKMGNIDPNLIFTIDTDLFYTIEGYDYLCDVLKTNLGVELPEVCRKLHTYYIEYGQELFGQG
jgi:hypothetical protein